MAELDKTRERGWSYAAGWSQEQLAYVARAWRERHSPLVTSNRVMLLLHSVSDQAADLDTAARLCAARCRRRDDNPTEELSEYEAAHVDRVASWKPRA